MNTDNPLISCRAIVPEDIGASRLDQIAAKLFPDYSRARLQSWIKTGSLLVDGRQLRPRDTVPAGAELSLNVEMTPEQDWVAETLPLDVIFENEQIIVLNKPANLVVHPAVGHRQGTLLNGLLAHCPQLESVPRAGIVHRLDKDTTGLLVVAKTLKSHAHLVERLQQRQIKREYEAVVQGVLTGGGTVDAPIGRHPVNRKKRAVYSGKEKTDNAHSARGHSFNEYPGEVYRGEENSGEGYSGKEHSGAEHSGKEHSEQAGSSRVKEAVTHYRVAKRYRAHTHIQLMLETGRTHQIRVHMSHLHYPVVGDQLYGGRLHIPAASSAALIKTLQGFKRQALHAKRLTLTLPDSEEELSWEAPLPADFSELLQALNDDLLADAEP